MVDSLVLTGTGTAPISAMDCSIVVAGHAGTLCDPAGEVFIKPCIQAEVDFYTTVNRSYLALAGIIPEFMGTLTLNDSTDINTINAELPGIADQMSVPLINEVVEFAHQQSSMHFKDPKHEKEITSSSIKTDQAIVLENIAYGFKRPNIMDVKIGVLLCADNVSPQKKARRKKTMEETTHKDLGLCVSGMRVYRGPGADGDPSQDDFKTFKRIWGKVNVTKDNVVESFREFIFNPAAGIDDDLGKMVAQGIVDELDHIESVIMKVETRIYSSSLLIVTEGDGHVLKARINELRSKSEPSTPSSPPPHAQQDQVSEGGSDSAEPPPRLWTVKLIDFAHAEFAPGQGPDENYLFGLRHLRNIFGKLAE